ncbi:YfdX family protein [Burkholderia sp. 22PA0099]|uniref:YfdX family protein n=1 Tax=Burkholderia sp. 22PA0099 TaxID=3237372 RepID=UPI0039C119BA
MKIRYLTSVVLMALTYASAAVAAEPTAAVAPKAASASAAAADVRRLSAQGSEAYRDIVLARLAIFNGKPALAKDLVKQARASLAKAKTDGTGYLRAESQLKQPVSPEHAASNEAGKSIYWLPVEGDVTVADDFEKTPDKLASIKAANAHLKQGQRQKAVDTLRLAGIDVTYTLGLVPLERTVGEVDKAQDLLDVDMYYEANNVLRHAQNDVWFDSVELHGKPVAVGANAASAAGK